MSRDVARHVTRSSRPTHVALYHDHSAVGCEPEELVTLAHQVAGGQELGHLANGLTERHERTEAARA